MSVQLANSGPVFGHKATVSHSPITDEDDQQGAATWLDHRWQRKATEFAQFFVILGSAIVDLDVVKYTVTV